MAFAHLPTLIEKRMADAIEAETFASSINVVTSTGGQLLAFPAVIVAVDKGSEEPPHSGNYECDVSITAISRVDPENAESYSDAVSAHDDLAGNLAEWLMTDTDATAASLGGTITGYTNTLTVESLRLDSFDRDINSEDGAFEDSLTVQLYAHMA